MLLCLCEIGWLYGKIETFLNKLLNANTNTVLRSDNIQSFGSSDLFHGAIAQAFAYAIQVNIHRYLLYIFRIILLFMYIKNVLGRIT